MEEKERVRIVKVIVCIFVRGFFSVLRSVRCRYKSCGRISEVYRFGVIVMLSFVFLFVL